MTKRESKRPSRVRGGRSEVKSSGGNGRSQRGRSERRLHQARSGGLTNDTGTQRSGSESQKRRETRRGKFNGDRQGSAARSRKQPAFDDRGDRRKTERKENRHGRIEGKGMGDRRKSGDRRYRSKVDRSPSRRHYLGETEKRGSGASRKRRGFKGGSQRAPSSPEALPDPAEILDRRVLKDVEFTANRKAPAALAFLTASAVAYEAGDYEAAVRDAQSAKRLAPRSSSIREMLGLSHYGAGDWARALSELRTYERLSGEKNHFPIIADCLRALGRPAKALELLDAQEAEDDPEALKIEAEIVRAGVLHDQGKIREAIGALRRVLREPKNVEYQHLRLWYLLAELFEEAGRPNEARMLFEKVAEHDSDFLDAMARAVNPDLASGSRQREVEMKAFEDGSV